MSQIAKVVLQLRHGTLVPSLFATPANRHMRLDHSGLRVQESLAPWAVARDAQGKPLPRRALVNSFGAGGAYAAVVLEECDPPPFDAEPGAGPWLFILSGQDAAALRRRLAQLRDWLAATLQDADLPRLAATLRRLDAEVPARIGIIAATRAEFAAGCDEALARPTAEGRVYGAVTPAAALAAEAEAWLAGASIDAAALLPPLRLPPYPFDHEAHFPLQPEERPEPDDLFARILAGDLTEDAFADMVQS